MNRPDAQQQLIWFRNAAPYINAHRGRRFVIHFSGETMQLDPVIPGWWDGFQMSYLHGEAIYEIQVDNPDHCERGVAWVELDGQRIGDGVISLARDLIKHRVLVRMGR